VVLRGSRVDVMEGTQAGQAANAADRDYVVSGFARGYGDPLRQTLVRAVEVAVIACP
jgi:hypothetical protein